MTPAINGAALPSARVPGDAFTHVDGWLPLVRATSPSMTQGKEDPMRRLADCAVAGNRKVRES